MLCNTKAVALVLLGASALLVEGKINAKRSLQSPDDIEFPEFRFKSWHFLTEDKKAFATTLGYVEGTWDQPGSADIESKSFGDLNGDKLAAVKGLGFNEDQWDCYVNHYGSFTWDDLEDEEVQEYFNVLGWSHRSWHGGGVTAPNTDGEDWEELTSEERQAAKELCYFKETWDGINLEIWDCTRDHYEFMTWDELEEEGVTEYFQILGWTHASWNGGSEEPPESDRKSWDDLTEEQHVAARKLCYYKNEWDGPAYPTFRYRAWEYLTSDQQANAKTLMYTEDSWNRIASNYIEKLTFDELEINSKQPAAKAIGFKEEVWDCYINHYEGYGWDELFDEGVQTYFVVLGWSSATWNDGESINTDELDWEELTPAQRTAARELCYIKETWAKISLDKWDCAKDHYFEETWADLKELGVQQYFITLGWDHMAWRNNEAPATENMHWNELTKEEEAAARNLCYIKEEWDGPTEYYPIFRYHLWDILDKDIKESATTLGYDRNSWNQVGSAEVEKHSYSALSSKKKKAADDMGFTDDTWDCWQNHYEDYYWSELEEFGVLQNIKAFGWTEVSWDDLRGIGHNRHPKDWDTDWEDLSRDLQEAAQNLCYFKETWDDLYLTQWDCASADYYHFEWDELKEKGVQGYFISLGWNKKSWDGDSDPPATEELPWNELSKEQRIAARQICYTKSTWVGTSEKKKKGGIIAGGVIVCLLFVIAAIGVLKLKKKKSMRDDGAVRTQPNLHAVAV